MNIMNFMKKLYNIRYYLIVTVILFCILTLIIVLSWIRKKDYYYYLNTPDVYYITNNNTSFDVELYTNHEKDNYINKESIISVFLKANNSSDFYELKLNNISENKTLINYDNKNFFEKILNFTFPFMIEETLQIDNAYLEFNFLSNEVLKINLGTFINYNEKSANHISILHMKSLTNKVNNLELFTGLVLRLTTTNDVLIKNIIPFDKRVGVNGKLIKKIDNSDFANNTPIENLINEKYNPLIINNDFNPIILNKDEVSTYIIPLTYEKLILINKMGFKITYEIDGISFNKIIYPFKFFNTNQKELQVTKHVSSIN